MLEDTATKAFRYTCAIDPLRAAADEGSDLMRFLDLYEIWVEKVRNELDVRYLTEMDLTSPEAKGLRDRLASVLDSELTDQARERLQDLQKIMDPIELEGRIVWIEKFRDGDRNLHSVPMDIGNLLWEYLYDACPTTMLLPPGKEEFFTSVIPDKMEIQRTDLDAGHLSPAAQPTSPENGSVCSSN